jgi:ABC-2 type transport system ATP-binding protein
LNVITTRELTKAYANIIAVDHCSFDVKEGEIFGFLGLNGAGKTTTIKMLTTLIPPTSGTATVLGFDILENGLEIRRRIGVVQQQESYDRNLTVRQSLMLYSFLWRVEKDEAASRVGFLLEKFGLKDSENRKVRWLTFGQRRRLQVAREFLHDASLLFLDEPTVGMDVLVRRSFLDFCKERAKKDGQTIFYTTHIVSEAEYLCDRVALIHKGKIIALDSPQELKKKYGGVKAVSIILRNSDELTKLVKLVEGNFGAGQFETFENSTELRIVSDEPYKQAYNLSLLMQKNGYDAESISVSEPSLEEVVVRLVRTKEVASE